MDPAQPPKPTSAPSQSRSPEDPQLTQHKGVTRQLVWMNGPQLFSGPELGDRAEPRAITSATLKVETHRGVWSSAEAQ